MTVPANKIATGQITLTGSSQQLVAAAFNYQSKSVRISNNDGSTKAYYSVSGVTETTGDVIEPGTSVSIETTDPRNIYVDGTTDDVLSYTIVYAG
ncbi:hypothetical protein [Sinimarinibacterium flocculans]|uniref:hypothetical protein n=1 Tax=Sinimarinibacterium flocculans TaxID=985250 RepID=UPI002490A94C|nr:hypothetical protein [Sinimarinibacterium flocculans]